MNLQQKMKNQKRRVVSYGAGQVLQSKVNMSRDGRCFDLKS